MITRGLNDESDTSRRRRRPREDDDSDLNSFIRPGESVDQNIQLLELIRSIESDRHAYDVRRRQLRIVSDLMEDYQHNIQLFLQYISTNMRNPDSSTRLRGSRSQSQPQPQPQPQHVPRPTPITPLNPRTGLTDRQVELGTRTVLYDISMNELRCPISLDEFAEGEEIAQIIGCGHVFKCAPLREWFRRNTHCPVCRYNLTTPSGRVRSTISGSRFANLHTIGSTGSTSTAVSAGNTYTTSMTPTSNARSTADAWTTLLTGLITTPSTGAYTFNREFVIPLQFDTEEADS